MSEYQQKEYPQKDNEGALFTNQKKATDTDPNYKGEVLIGGNSFWVNGPSRKQVHEIKFYSKGSSPQQWDETG